MKPPMWCAKRRRWSCEGGGEGGGDKATGKEQEEQKERTVLAVRVEEKEEGGHGGESRSGDAGRRGYTRGHEYTSTKDGLTQLGER